ncbi:hypothetical protein GJ496_005026 [Pomphorhynchus laevis]|nr:hypothetical protein GJ496_005026 [Pomphorhynchus laevis]
MQYDSEDAMAKTLSIPYNYLHQVRNATINSNRDLMHVINTGKLPLKPIDTLTVLTFLDSYSKTVAKPLGEPSFLNSSLLSERWLNLNRNDWEPLNDMLNRLTRDALHICHYKSFDDMILLPWATGMTMSLMLSILNKSYNGNNIVAWFRIDQKSCIKSIELCNDLICINPKDDDVICNNIEKLIEVLSVDNCGKPFCVVSTTSCFAPRVPDDVIVISKLCRKYEVAHLVNNAYGIQSKDIAKMIEKASRLGRIDYVVQSMDKNFMVPVGGSIVIAYNQKIPQWLKLKYGSSLQRTNGSVYIVKK